MSRNFCCGGVSSRNSLVEMYAGYPWRALRIWCVKRARLGFQSTTLIEPLDKEGLAFLEDASESIARAVAEAAKRTDGIKDVLIGSYKMSEQESKPSRDRNRRWDATKPLMGDPRKLGSAVDCVGHKGGSITGI